MLPHARSLLQGLHVALAAPLHPQRVSSDEHKMRKHGSLHSVCRVSKAAFPHGEKVFSPRPHEAMDVEALPASFFWGNGMLSVLACADTHIHTYSHSHTNIPSHNHTHPHTPTNPPTPTHTHSVRDQRLDDFAQPAHPACGYSCANLQTQPGKGCAAQLDGTWYSLRYLECPLLTFFPSVALACTLTRLSGVLDGVWHLCSCLLSCLLSCVCRPVALSPCLLLCLVLCSTAAPVGRWRLPVPCLTVFKSPVALAKRRSIWPRRCCHVRSCRALHVSPT